MLYRWEPDPECRGLSCWIIKDDSQYNDQGLLVNRATAFQAESFAITQAVQVPSRGGGERQTDRQTDTKFFINQHWWWILTAGNPKPGLSGGGYQSWRGWQSTVQFLSNGSKLTWGMNSSRKWTTSLRLGLRVNWNITPQYQWLPSRGILKNYTKRNWTKDGQSCPTGSQMNHWISYPEIMGG